MRSEPQGYNPIFEEHRITEAQAFQYSREGKAAIKAHDKFMQKQMKKPRARYLKKLRYGEQV
jgi:hypothetical protein